MRTSLFAAAVLGLSVAFTLRGEEARANGRFPESNAIFFAPNDHDLVVLRTTFGEVVSHDRGKTWDWLCERSVGLAGVEDPMYAITPNSTLIASTFQGLAVSHDKACNFAFAGGALKELVFIDLTSRPSTPGHVVAFASSYDGQDDAGAIFFKSTLFETTDEGVSFTMLGSNFDPTLLGETVDVAPSDVDRIYVSAVRNPGTAVNAFLLTSKDHGKTYIEAAIPLLANERAVFIAAVDPVNADRVYVRTSSDADKPSRLLVSDDAGKTFKTALTSNGPMLGFALSSDGTKVWIGGPLDGIKMASTADFVFTQKSKVEAQCLKLADDGLWACSTEKTGFVVGLSKDDGATFATKMHFCDIRGPLTCGPGTSTNTECALGGTGAMATPPWPAQRAVLGCAPDTSGADGGSTDDGGPNADGGMNPGDNGDGGGGGCSMRAPSATPFAALIAAAAAAIAIARRRKRRG